MFARSSLPRFHRGLGNVVNFVFSLGPEANARRPFDPAPALSWRTAERASGQPQAHGLDKSPSLWDPSKRFCDNMHLFRKKLRFFVKGVFFASYQKLFERRYFARRFNEDQIV